ncbi:hypothetical protein PAL_GLEAN10018451 [Pteropus alecto]|uniref:Uncharacterized protein n=1 Tax=Pteropus alecto TaxID=9402 RepID=L5KXJ1_PTEAL|nr:hypothetical protein PAL_GLEAN10018451 [Pteropus alecto]
MPESPRDRGFPAPNTHEKKGSSSKLLLSILNILALSRAAADADRLEDDVTRRGRDRSLPLAPRRRFSFGHEGGAREERRSGTQTCFPIGCWFPYVTKRGGRGHNVPQPWQPLSTQERPEGLLPNLLEPLEGQDSLFTGLQEQKNHTILCMTLGKLLLVSFQEYGDRSRFKLDSIQTHSLATFSIRRNESYI